MVTPSPTSGGSYFLVKYSLYVRRILLAFVFVFLAVADVVHQVVLRKQGALEIGRPILIVGMEAAGGILASQLAAMYVQQSGSASFSMVFGYLRKNRKSSGTKQQLEGPAAAVLEQRCLLKN